MYVGREGGNRQRLNDHALIGLDLTTITSAFMVRSLNHRLELSTVENVYLFDDGSQIDVLM